MGQNTDADAIRSGIDGLTHTAATAHSEIDDIAESLRAATDQIAHIATADMPRREASALESALHDITGDMLRTVDDLQHNVATAIDTQSAELETLLRPDNLAAAGPATNHDDPPPLPPLDDLDAIKGTPEWASAVVERYPRLTTDEVLAIYHYTTVEGVREMNGHLRHPERTPEADRVAIQKRIDDAAAGLAKLPKVPGISFRGTDLPQWVLNQWAFGAKVHDPGFVSTSLDDAIAERFRDDGNALITITGHSGVNVQQLSHYGHEAEILFQPSTRFRVLDVTWDDEQSCWRFRAMEEAA